ncbi:MAG: penicillin-binding transpeptidase domain-containing protein [Gemmatimonadaceae bacterium]|nr:penicillin-binding transpeptidase domain-containing protein [Gemmatimonadaceae bacterium]
MHSAPTYDPNRFVGGIPADYWRELNADSRRPLYNKVIQGRYPPASTWKLATSAMAMEAGLVQLDSIACPCHAQGGYQLQGRYFRCWDRKGHGDVTLRQAIAQVVRHLLLSGRAAPELPRFLVGG